MNINTYHYWDRRFASNDWEAKGGRSQTINFAISQIKYLKISKDFDGTILDFGCALGDAIPIYKQNYKKANLIGVDISKEAIQMCKSKYSELASFIVGSYEEIPFSDVIIASNVFEHLSDDKRVASELLNKCKDLYIIVPYKERLCEGTEHINSYDELYFENFKNSEHKIFYCKGWSQTGLQLIINVYLKNLVRPFLGKQIIKRRKQIIFHLKSLE